MIKYKKLMCATITAATTITDMPIDEQTQCKEEIEGRH